MLYRNTETGAEIKTKSTISAPHWILVGADTPPQASPKAEAPKEPEVIQEKETEIKERPVKKTAPKKTVKRTKK